MIFSNSIDRLDAILFCPMSICEIASNNPVIRSLQRLIRCRDWKLFERWFFLRSFLHNVDCIPNGNFLIEHILLNDELFFFVWFWVVFFEQRQLVSNFAFVIFYLEKNSFCPVCGRGKFALDGLYLAVSLNDFLFPFIGFILYCLIPWTVSKHNLSMKIVHVKIMSTSLANLTHEL